MNDFINHMVNSKKRLAGLDPKDNPWVIKHNGVIVERAGTQDRAMQKLMQIQNHSIWEATRKDGYTIENEPVNEEKEIGVIGKEHVGKTLEEAFPVFKGQDSMTTKGYYKIQDKDVGKRIVMTDQGPSVRTTESKVNEKTNTWDVFLNGKKIDTVTDQSDDPSDVKSALVNHDGYDAGITVKRHVGSYGSNEGKVNEGGAVDDAIGFLRKQWGDEEIVDHIMHDWRLDQANAQQVLAQAKQRVNKEMADHGLASPVESKTVTGVLRLLKTLKEGVIKSFWVVTKAGPQSTLDDICFEATPQSLMNQAKGGLRTDELVALYDNEKEAKVHADGLLKTRTTEGKVPDDADPEDKKIEKLTEDGRDPEDKIEDKPDGEDGPDVKRPEDPANPTPAEGEEQEKDTITKEYIGKKEETHFYMVGTPSNTPSSEEGADTPDDLQIVDQEGKKLWSASEQEIDPSDPANFIMQAIQELEIDEITRSVLVKYILPKMTEEEEGPEEIEAEEPTEDVDAASGKPDEELPAGEERKNPFERKLRTGSKIAERCAARKALMLKEDHDEAAWDGIIKAIEDKDSKYEAVVTLMAEVWNGGFEQWIDNGIAEEEGRLAIRMLRKIGTDSANKMADLAEEAMKSDFYEMAVVDRNIQDPENDYEENAEELSKLDDQFYGGLDDQLVKDLAAKLGVGKATEAKVNEIGRHRTAFDRVADMADMASRRQPDKYVAQDGKTVVNDYDGAGTFTLEEAGKVCLNHEYGIISPDASGKWIVIVNPSTHVGNESKVNEAKDPQNLKAKLKKALAGFDWLGTRADDEWTEGMSEIFQEVAFQLLTDLDEESASAVDHLISGEADEDLDLDMLSDLITIVQNDFVAYIAGRKRTAKKNEAKVPDDADAEDKKIMKLIETKVQMGDDTFTVYQVDDGTEDTVIDINGQEYRFEKDFAAMWRDEATGELTADGLQELALDALSNMGEEEYAQLVAAGDKRSQDQIDADEDQRVRDKKADMDYDAREEDKLVRSHENEAKVNERNWKNRIDLSVLAPYTTGDMDAEDMGPDDLNALCKKVRDAIYAAVEKWEDKDTADRFRSIADNIEMLNDVEELDQSLEDLYSLGDETSTWIMTAEDEGGGKFTEAKVNERKKLPDAFKKNMFKKGGKKSTAKKDDSEKRYKEQHDSKGRMKDPTTGKPYKNESKALPDMRGKRDMDLLKNLLGFGQ